MPDETVEVEWTPARLIPTVGIRGQEEQEKRATSSLLAVMRAVPEFGHALLKDLGAPKGRIASYAEVRFKDADGNVSIPDGAIVDHEASGASGFDDMESDCVKVRDGARQQTLRAADKEVRTVAERWDQFGQYVCLGLSQDLGVHVSVARPRGQTHAQRIDSLVRSVVESGLLEVAVKVPATVAPLEVSADLRTRQVHTSVTLDAPKEGRPAARVNWLLKQLKDAPETLRIEVRFAGARETTSLLLREAREYPQRLLSPTDPKREPRAFALVLSRGMGLKRGKGRGSFVHDTRVQAFEFYRELMQNLKAWQPKAPKLRDERDEEPEVPRVEEGIATPPPIGHEPAGSASEPETSGL